MVSILLIQACVPTLPVLQPWPHLTLNQWNRHNQRFSKEQLVPRLQLPKQDVRQEVKISLVELITGHTFEGRGLLAIRPNVALRMVLLSPSGTTSFDLWIHESHYRIEIPMLRKIVRGNLDSNSHFASMASWMKQWLVNPLDGQDIVGYQGSVHSMGNIVEDSNKNFIVWVRQHNRMHVRAYAFDKPTITTQGWWFEQGRWLSFVESTNTQIDSEFGTTLIPTRIQYTSLEPAFTMRVDALKTELLRTQQTLPERVFQNPDTD